MRALALGTALTVGLFYLGSQPFAVGLFDPPYDKFAHFGFFFALASVFWLAVDGRWPLWVVLFVSGLGALDEWHQAYLPGRSVDVVDFLVDLVAAVCAVGLLLWHRRG